MSLQKGRRILRSIDLPIKYNYLYKKIRLYGFLSFSLFVFFEKQANADLSNLHISHQRSLLPGDRALLLGGAYTALSDDPSGLYYNPSGIAYTLLPDASMNVLFSEYSTEFVFKNAVEGKDFIEKSKTNFSSTSGGSFRSGNFTYAYTFLGMDNRSINQNDHIENFSEDPSESFLDYKRQHQETSAYNLMGLGFAYGMTKKFSVGISVFYYKRKIEAMNYQFLHYDDNSLRMIISKINTSNEGLLPIFGLQYRSDRLSLGISYRRGIAFSDRTKINIETTNIDNINASQSIELDSVSTSSNLNQESNPDSYSLGLAFRPFSGLLLSSDLIYHQGKKLSNSNRKLLSTLNASFGSELGSGALGLLLGIMTNRSMLESINPSTIGPAVHVDFLGYSSGFIIRSKSLEASFGGIIQKGKGKSKIVNTSDEIQDIEAMTSHYFVSAKYNF